MSGEPHIKVEGLEIGWGAITLLQDVSFEVPRASAFALLGGSGCGKSSLLRHLVGLERPRGGSIFVEGVGNPADFEGRPPFGMMFQSGALFGSMTLGENLALALESQTNLPGPVVAELARAKLELVGLGPFVDHLPGEISGGMKKRAGIARALMLEPELLFLDEPSAGLDPTSAVELDDLMNLLSRELGITVVLVTHELPSIFRVADACIVLDREARGVVDRGDPRELQRHSGVPFVQHFFNRTSPRQEGAT